MKQLLSVCTQASFFYFEQIKNIVYLYIFHTALEDMTKAKGGPTDPDHSFELFMVCSTFRLRFMLMIFFRLCS